MSLITLAGGPGEPITQHPEGLVIQSSTCPFHTPLTWTSTACDRGVERSPKGTTLNWTRLTHRASTGPRGAAGHLDMSLRAVLFLQGYLVLAAAMFFQLGEQEEKCIIEEIPVDMLVTGESRGGKIQNQRRKFR